jgi:hypothetical protein
MFWGKVLQAALSVCDGIQNVVCSNTGVKLSCEHTAEISLDRKKPHTVEWSPKLQK